ncbi:hypothetical protein B0T20DRAFT_351883 [Sordaria brevicollis]|uniref:Uncharacterized protein n=1 Tax=Sordaria brevicollis TaxID=83679 RepID=A0AAE0PG17_SORBR|nr:hypothetical protein B0T20DRAFT_351883 [Sordaria brevicollis]
MSTAIAMAASPAPHDRPSYGSDVSASASTAAPASTSSPSAQRTAAVPPPPPPSSSNPNAPAPRSGSGSPRAVGATPAAHKSSPPSASRSAGGSAPRIIVKKEPGSPEAQQQQQPPPPPPPTARHRPSRLDLSKNTSTNNSVPGSARPLTARDTSGLGIKEVGIACLSPGFVTHDPLMKEQVHRSMSVKEQQKRIIESRLQQQSAGFKAPELPDREKDGGHFAAKTPGLARKRGPPPGLSIVAPSHEQFANERVIQSAPLGQSFPGRQNPHPLTRHLMNHSSNLASTSHIHHVPAKQTNNRLPPISDVFGQGLSGHPDSSGHALFASQSHSHGPLASPHHPPPPPPPQPQPPTSARPREYKSAEEAQQDLAAGRTELLPKYVHYNSSNSQHQPPTPPSPPNGPAHHHAPPPPTYLPSTHASSSQRGPPSHISNMTDASRSASNNTPGNNYGSSNMHSNTLPSSSAPKRRTRAEYEEGGTPPLGNGRAPQRRSGPFGEGRDSPETQRAKKEEFIRLCERAWDLFHS